MNTNKIKASIIKSVSSPLGFYVLTLLTVEGFLTIVLIYSGLDQKSKFWGMVIGAGLFVLVIIIVSLLVAFKSKELIFGEESHLLDEGKIPYGESGKVLTRAELEKKPKSELNEILTKNR